tara:strand:- start:4780 stop:5850 length:1071 start_codon:yes stop_codon:yes gene_type:complete
MIIDSGNILDSYTECTDCNALCYLITRCDDPEAVYYTDQDFSVYVGKVIQWKTEEMIFCGTVTSFTCRDIPDEELPPLFPFAISDCFDNCEDCYPEPDPDPADFELSQRTVKPGYGTDACTPAYWDKVKCKFSEAAYQHMASIRYGIEFCCNNDMQKWVIKNELLDLEAINDPDICNETCDESQTSIEVGEAICNSENGFYTQDLIITYPDTITEGQIIVNGQSFDVDVSPQTITLENLLANGAPVDVTVSFSESDLVQEYPALYTATDGCPPIYENYIVTVAASSPAGSLFYTTADGPQELAYPHLKVQVIYYLVCAMRGSITNGTIHVLVDGVCPVETGCTNVAGVTIVTSVIC